MTPLVSVIIPCFNAEAWIRETLQSVIEQKIDSLEIIVIDDGSSDKSITIIEKEFPFAQIIRQEHGGPSKARNLGTKISKGYFIQYLDADDLLACGKLRLQLETLKGTDADVAYGDWQKLIETKKGKFINGEQIKQNIQDAEIDLFTGFWCPPAVYLFRRSIVEKVGEWNERLQIIQDSRFALDCALNGAKFVYCKGTMAYYRVHRCNSVSTRDSVEFVRDCLNNAIEIEEKWRAQGVIGEEHKKALLKVYGYVARASFEIDQSIFNIAFQRLKKLTPSYIPEKPILLRLLSKIIGYRRAEIFAYWYRRAKGVFV